MKILEEDKYMYLRVSRSSNKIISLHVSLKKSYGNIYPERILILKFMKAFKKIFKRHSLFPNSH